MKLTPFLALSLVPALALQAQSPAKPAAKPAETKKTETKPAAAPVAKETPEAKAAREAAAAKAAKEAQEARQQFEAVLQAVDAAWFGEAYKDIKAVDIDGSVNLSLSAEAMNRKVAEMSQGTVKGGLTKNGNASARMKGTYFARGDFRTEFTGDFGNMIWTRVGNKGFIYSKELGAHTNAVDLGPADAPLTWMTWFRETIQDIKKAYIDAPVFRAELGKEETANGQTLRTVIFSAPTGKYDPAKREQALASTLVFWKRGHMQLTYDKATRLPKTMIYTNEGQGIRTRMDFAYDANKRIQRASLNNQSRGFEGPGGLMVTYGSDGRMNRIAGEITSKDRKVGFDLGLSWAKDKAEASIRSVPPPTSKRMGGDEFVSLFLVSASSQVMELQRYGWNIMAPKVAVATSK